MTRQDNPVDEAIDRFVIDARFCGPPESGNGGYVCGRLAHYVGSESRVRLIRPPPLKTDLEVVRTEKGVELRRGEEPVARAWREAFELDVPPSPGIEAARSGRAAYSGHHHHAFPGCFVCGIQRRAGDGLLIHPGPAGGAGRPEHFVACNWAPDRSLCDASGRVHDHFVWAALDCPGAWSFLSFEPETAVLGELSARLHSPLPCRQEVIVAGWEVDRAGRKRHTGSAVYSVSGGVLAEALATWIVIEANEAPAFTGR